MQKVNAKKKQYDFIRIIEDALSIGEEKIKYPIGNVRQYEKESDRDYATSADLYIERAISKFLKKETPAISIIGEELSSSAFRSPDHGQFWVIDPIDGTANFSRDLPLYGISIALIFDGKPIACGLSFPRLGERFISEHGAGAYLNGNRMHVSRRTELRQMIAASGDFSVEKNGSVRNELRYSAIRIIGDNCLRTRMLGSAALQLAWLAAGRLDISLTFSNKAWDVQAGVLLVREAGGEAFDADGTPHSVMSLNTIAANCIETKEKILALLSIPIEEAAFILKRQV